MYLVMKDVTGGRIESEDLVVCEIKLGKREHGGDVDVVTPEKAILQMAKCVGTSSFSLGLRVIGARVPDLLPDGGLGEWERVAKAEGRGMVDKAEVADFVAGRVCAGASGSQMTALRTRLGEVEAALRSAPNVSLFSSSILFGYVLGGDPSTVFASLIDFTHGVVAQTLPSGDGGGDDGGVLDGIQVLRDMIDPIRRDGQGDGGGRGFEVVRGDYESVRSVEALAGLVNKVYGVAERGLWMDGFARTSVEEIQGLVDTGENDPEGDGSRVLVARVEATGEVVGVVGVHKLKHPGGDPSFVGEFGMLAVAPGARGYGVGRALVEAAQAEAQEVWGVEVMMLELLTPRDWIMVDKSKMDVWYRKLGYVPTQAMPFEDKLPHLVPYLDTDVNFTVYLKQLPQW